MSKAYTPVRLFVFWGYDTFPYLLGGEATKIDAYGRFYVPAYQGWVRTKKVLPIKEGMALLAKLEALKAERDTALKKLNEEFMKKAEEVFGEKVK